MKKSFFILEFILIITVILIVYFSFSMRPIDNKLDIAKERLILYLKYLRFKSLIDNKLNNDKYWYMQRWTLKFLRCANSNDIYYVIYSDKNKTGHPSQNESLIDPLTNKFIYSSNKCIENNINSKYTLLTKNFNVVDISISCNNTSSLGQISFGHNGKIYNKLSRTQEEFSNNMINDKCIIKLKDINNQEKNIIINKNGLIN